LNKACLFVFPAIFRREAIGSAVYHPKTGTEFSLSTALRLE